MVAIGFNFLSRKGVGRRAMALFCLWALVWSSVANAASVQVNAAGRKPSANADDELIIHVLNRLGFGPRPGDVERVRAMGIERYIEEQLHPERIDDSATEARLQNLQAPFMATRELLAKYPNPGQLIRVLDRQGKLPPDLATLRDEYKKQNGVASSSETSKSTSAAGPANNSPKPTGDSTVNGGEKSKREFRRDLRQYFIENGLLPPQRITQEMQAQRIIRAVYSERQLQEVMVDFWMNHFNVYADKGLTRWYLPEYEREVIRPHALGKFRDLLVATAQSPAMLFYLDNFQSVSPNAPPPRRQALSSGEAMRLGRLGLGAAIGRGRNLPRLMERQAAIEAMRAAQAERKGQPQMRPSPARRRGINENYARELMELHTLGVDGGYTQKDVQEVARCFTGWTIFDPYALSGQMVSEQGGPLAQRIAQILNERAGKFVFNPRMHDTGEKVVLGHKIPAGGGIEDGLKVLDILSRHPSTARFIATKLCRRFVSDDPPQSLIDRVAQVFLKTDGDIRETLRAIFTSPEFYAPEARRAKIKTPFELVVSAIRALGGDTDGGPAIHNWIARMGEPLYLYQAPNGYPDRADYWVNTGALLERINFAIALAHNRIPGTRVDVTKLVPEFAAKNSLTAEDRRRIFDRFVTLFLDEKISPQARERLIAQLDPAAPQAIGAQMERTAVRSVGSETNGSNPAVRNGGMTGARAEIARIAALVLGSPEFQRQ
ncbi:MAG: DUF1800 domain-containing protein [Pyrinomonas methylaliphatogenes]|nr:DUF1800 domain-containing protein [Pyrinomonas methylaliphatogenes]